MPNLPGDAMQFTDLTQVPHPLLREWFEAQAQWLAVIIRMQGGSIRIPVEEWQVNKNYRIFAEQHVDGSTSLYLEEVE